MKKTVRFGFLPGGDFCGFGVQRIGAEYVGNRQNRRR